MSSDLVTVSFSLGSNVGDKIANIIHALDEMHALSGLTLEKASSFYRTAPWGVSDQDWFINVCALGETSLAPRLLMSELQAIEKDLGREKTIRWGPRLIDIDILYYGNQSLETEELTIPHKSLKERAFVLVPLAEISPEQKIDDQNIVDYLRQSNLEDEAVLRLERKPWAQEPID